MAFTSEAGDWGSKSQEEKMTEKEKENLFSIDYCALKFSVGYGQHWFRWGLKAVWAAVPPYPPFLSHLLFLSHLALSPLNP